MKTYFFHFSFEISGTKVYKRNRVYLVQPYKVLTEYW